MILSQLSIYPVKSTAQVSLEKAPISPFGLEMDRRWMLVDSSGMMLTQRKHAKMCLIQGHLNHAQQLSLRAPDMPDIKVPQSNETTILATVWNDTCNAEDCGDEVAQWCSEFLGIETRLAFFPSSEVRQVDTHYAQEGDTTAFSDGFPYLLISQASLDDLNTRLTDSNKSTVEMTRFRPNLVISGTDAFAEDQWKKIRIGNISFRLVKPCSRCIIPSINPQTAEKNADVIKALTAYRTQNNKIFFGQNLIAEGNGELSVGMPVEILE